MLQDDIHGTVAAAQAWTALHPLTRLHAHPTPCSHLGQVPLLSASPPPLHPPVQDDIQGTAATAVAGLHGALRVLGQPTRELARQRVVCVGAGSAGMGVVGMIKSGA